MWEVLRTDNYYTRKGYKVNKGRFFSVVHDGLYLAKRWTSTLFEVAVPMIELDMCATKVLPKLQLKFDGADPQSNPDTTSAKKLSVGDRSLRSCGANAVVIAAAMLSEDSHRRLLISVTSLAEVWLPKLAKTSQTQSVLSSPRPLVPSYPLRFLATFVFSGCEELAGRSEADVPFSA